MQSRLYERFALLLVLPLAVEWLMGFGGPSLEPLISAQEYFGFAISMTMAFGVADARMLDRVKPGDKIRFVADKVNGTLTVVTLQSA